MQQKTSAPSAWTHAAAVAAGLAAFVVGAVDLFTVQHLTVAGDVSFMLTGLGALGVKATGALG